MLRNKILRVFGGIMILALLVSTAGMPAKAQDSAGGDGVTVEPTGTLTISPEPAQAEAVYDSPPALTEEQLARLEWGAENTHLAPPIETEGLPAVAGPQPGTETVGNEERPRSGEALAPGTASTFIWTQFGGVIPAGFKSNIMETSTAGKASRIFATGNWWAARSLNKGISWTYLSAYNQFADFCCDQVVVHDLTRDIYIWLRMGVPNANGENVFKLDVDFAEPFTSSWWVYTISSASVGAGTWWDYPHMQLGADYLYITWNMFNAAGGWVRSLMMRFPLDTLAAAGAVGLNYLSVSDYFTFVPVSGAQHVMYFASNWAYPYNTLRIYRWNEAENFLTFWTRTVPTFTPSGRGAMVCGSPNWLARTDMRVLTGARYFQNFNGTDDSAKQPGRAVLGWWWNVAQGGAYTRPYIEGAAFYEDTITLLPGNPGRPLFYNNYDCFAYPSLSPNIRGDLGGVFNLGSGAALQKPLVYYTIADDFAGASPPGWAVFGAAASTAGSSSATWGDYNTVRTYQLGSTWIGSSHFISPSASNCSNCSVPLWIGFGRERDRVNFSWW